MLKKLMVYSILLLVLMVGACSTIPSKEITKNPLIERAVVLNEDNKKVIRPLRPGEKFCIVFYVHGNLQELATRFILQYEGKPVFSGNVTPRTALIEKGDEDIHKVTIPLSVPESGVESGDYALLLVIMNLRTGEAESVFVNFEIRMTTDI